MDVAVARRRRAIVAMGLGPVWTARSDDEPGTPGVADADRTTAIAAMDHDLLARAVSDCRACRLGETRLRAVVGDGPGKPRLVLVGTAPDAADESAGSAWAGAPGRLLDAMLGAIGCARTTDTFVTHLVKCRPPGDRAPTDDEVATCAPFLARQTALLAPLLVVALGDRAATEDGRLVVPDPRSLIDAPDGKSDAWVALCEVRRRMVVAQ